MSFGYSSPEPWNLSDEDTGIMHGGEGVEQPPSSDTDQSVFVETPSPSESPGKLNTAIVCPVTVASRKLETLLSQSSLDNADNRIPLAARFQEEFQEHHWPSLFTEEGVQWTWFPGQLPKRVV